MFGIGSTGNPSAPPTKSKKNYSQFGLMDVNDITDIADEDDFDDVDDEDLEAELLALTSGHDPKPKKPAKPTVNEQDLQRMIKDSLRDIPSDEDVSSGEDDPNLIAELEELQVGSTVTVENIPANTEKPESSIKSLLLERLHMYETAEQNAKSINETSKARRMARGITTLKELIKQADSGRAVNESDIPPVVSTAPPKLVPAVPAEAVPVSDPDISPPAPEVSPVPPPVPPRSSKHSSPSINDTSDEPEIKVKATPVPDNILDTHETDNVTGSQDINLLLQRQDEYKKAAVEAKKKGDIQTALNYVKIVKQFDSVIAKAKEGAIVDLASLPPALVSCKNISERPKLDMLQKQESIRLRSSNSVGADIPESSELITPKPVADPYVEPKTVMEALEQRLKRYQESEEAAKAEDNASKIRRMGRIIKQYQDAIKLHKAGKPIPVDELPTPPGFAPIPVNGAAKVPAPVSAHQNVPAASTEAAERKKPPVAPVAPPSAGVSSGATRNEKQLQAVLERQKQFKDAALQAKKEGNVEAAKEFLRTAKGFDRMIEACRCGLPVDMSSLPIAPNENAVLETDYQVVQLNDNLPGTDIDVFQKLQNDLKQQIIMCTKTRDNFKAMGDIANANRMDQLAVKTKKDLTFVQMAEAHDLRIPKFHYETKPFTIVQCNTDLTDNEVEVIVAQGINYNVPNPNEVDTYVKIFFPYPTETPQQFKTKVVYNTNNPEYNTTTKFNMQRNNRACVRIFKRQALKCEVWSKGGFFRSDSLIGTVNAKLQPLETQCTIHDAFDLMDGRKTIGGKLELKLKVRNPMLRKEVVHVEEKWLIIDS